MKRTAPKSVDEYIAQFPDNIKKILEKMRKAIKEAAPQAEETISYQMPAYKLNGILVYFAAFKDHISFFPTASGVSAFKKELSGYKTSKGTIQLPIDKLPLELIKKIVRYRARENKN